MQVFLLITRTSALTMSIGGVAKDWLLVGLSLAMYSSAGTRVNFAGYFLAFLSVRFCCSLRGKEVLELPLARSRLRRHMPHHPRQRLLSQRCGCPARLQQSLRPMLPAPLQVLYYCVDKIRWARQQAQQQAAAAALSRMSRAPSEEGIPLVERHAGADRI